MKGDTAGTQLRTGVRNPFVYAEHKLNEKIKWHEMKPGSKRKKLEKAFGISYNQLFDPTKESPLFVKPDIKTGDMRQCITVSDPKWRVNPQGSTYTITSRAYTDLVQGDLPDCFFIAALSSVAFAAPGLILNQTTTPYSYTFYKPPLVEGDRPQADTAVQISNLLPLDSSLRYHYSKSYTAGEVWPAMYEKAFAVWKNRSNGTDSDTPDYMILCQGDPVTALLNLTGWKFTTFKPKPGSNPVTSTATKYLTQDFTDITGTQIFTKIKDYACKTSGPYKIAQYPTVAFTYDPRIESIPSGITYDDATIVGNHAYSVLGVHTVGSVNYIVMRNPWGQKGAGPGTGDPDPSHLPSDALASGSWYQITNLSDPNDAIFALKASVFRDYFKGFGWVKT